MQPADRPENAAAPQVPHPEPAPRNMLLEAALRYAEDRGFRVFPCDQNKKPLTAHGFKDATTDPEQIEAWWAESSNAQIGIACDGFWVLDVDGPEGERSFAELTKGRPIYTAVVRTARGRHYWFRGRGPGTRVGIRPKIDTRGIGGYVIVPPSIHATGHRYSWEVSLDDMTEAPEWLTAELGTTTSTAPNSVLPQFTANDGLPPLTAAEVRRIGEAMNVIRDAADHYGSWIEVGMALHHHTRGSSQGWDIWLSWSRLSSKFKGEADCMKHWRTFGRRSEEVTIATLFHRAAAASPDPVVSASFANAAALPPEAPSSPLPPVLSPIEVEHAISRVYATTPAKPMRWIVEGMIPRGKLGFLGAQGGAGKTEIAMQLAIAMATGRPWLGQMPIEPGAVRTLVLLGEDDPDSAHMLIERVCDGMGLLDDEREIVDANVKALALAGQACPLGVADPRTKEVLATTHLGGLMRILEREADRLDATGEPCPYGLIIVDTCARFGPAETEIDNAAATRYCQILERITQARGGPTVLVLAHTPKSARGKDADEFSLRGSTALSDSARFVLALVGDGTGQSGELWIHKANFKADRTRFRLVRPRGILQVSGAVDPAEKVSEDRGKKVGEKTKKNIEREHVNAEAKKRSEDALAQKAIPFVLPIVQEQQGIIKGELQAAVGRAASVRDTAAQSAIDQLIANKKLVVVSRGVSKLHYTHDHYAAISARSTLETEPSSSSFFSPHTPLAPETPGAFRSAGRGEEGRFPETNGKRSGNGKRSEREDAAEMADRALAAYEERTAARDALRRDPAAPIGPRIVAYIRALPGAFRGRLGADFEAAGMDREEALAELDRAVERGVLRVEVAEFTGKQFYYPTDEDQQ